MITRKLKPLICLCGTLLLAGCSKNLNQTEAADWVNVNYPAESKKTTNIKYAWDFSNVKGDSTKETAAKILIAAITFDLNPELKGEKEYTEEGNQIAMTSVTPTAIKAVPAADATFVVKGKELTVTYKEGSDKISVTYNSNGLTKYSKFEYTDKATGWVSASYTY